VAKEDLIRIHNYGVKQFGIKQADKYFESFFVHFDIIAENPQSFEAVDFIKPGYRRNHWTARSQSVDIGLNGC
jgi:toxin ParE1/3/4